jgi:cytoskeleton protein RodZ
MELHEIGTLFRREREKQGLSVEDVVEKTRISRRNITAIENGDENLLPHPVYAKGFVKAYAEFLGLDPKEISPDFSKTALPKSGRLRMPGESSGAGQHQSPRRALSIVVVLLVVLLGIGAMTMYFVLHDRRQANVPESTEPAPTQVPTQVPTQAPTPPPAPTQVPTPAPTSKPEPAAPAEAPVLMPAEEVEPVGSESPASFPSPEPAAVPVQETAPPQPPEQVQQRSESMLRIMADQSCWVQASVDGRQVERILKPGQSMSLAFTSSLSVRLGNAGGVRVTHNGAPYPLNGQPGEVRVLRFP